MTQERTLSLPMFGFILPKQKSRIVSKILGALCYLYIFAVFSGYQIAFPDNPLLLFSQFLYASGSYHMAAASGARTADSGTCLPELPPCI
jgi:hypothetical protein